MVSHRCRARHDDVNDTDDGCVDRLDRLDDSILCERDADDRGFFYRAPLKRTGPTEPVWVCEGFGRG
jgi:hypothetical protein